MVFHELSIEELENELYGKVDLRKSQVTLEMLEDQVKQKILKLKPNPVTEVKLKGRYLEELRFQAVMALMRSDPSKVKVSQVNQLILEMEMIIKSKIRNVK